MTAQQTRKWLSGVVGIAALAMSLGSAASAPPRVLEWGSPHRDLIGAMRNRQVSRHLPCLERAGRPVSKDAPRPEAYTLTGYGFSEGSADQIATNGNVVVWANNGTYFGNVTFAAAGDMAHAKAVLYSPAMSMAGIQNPIQFVGNRCYINAVFDILEVDVSDPNNIQFIADYDMSCFADPSMGITDFRVRNGYVYAALCGNGFIIYRIGNPTWPVMFGNAVHASQNPSLAIIGEGGFWPTLIEVTDDAMILIDNAYDSGSCYVWDITNMVDPIHTVFPCPGGYSRDNPFSDAALFGSITQFQYVTGWGFVAGANYNYNATVYFNAGVTRFDWADVTDVDSFLVRAQIVSVNDGTNGRARYVNNFVVLDGGNTVFTSYEDVRDPGPPTTLPDIDGDAGEKWDWSTWAAPNSLLTYKMDRFFFNKEDNFETPVSFNVFYGGAHIAFHPASPGSSFTFIAGWNYCARFDDAGVLADHYVVGADPTDWPWLSRTQYYNRFTNGVQPLYKMPPAASVWNHVQAPDGSFALVWYPEGVYVHDNLSGQRAGSWEVPSRADFVRNAALTGDGRYALVSCGSLGLIILDLTIPTLPMQVGAWWTNPGASQADRQPVTYVFVKGSYAYVQTRVLVTDPANPTANINVVRVLDVSVPALPAEVASYASPQTGLQWDVNHMEATTPGTYLGRDYLQIANGQGGDPSTAFNPAFGNSRYRTADRGSLVIAEVTTPSLLSNRFNVPLTTGTYAFSSAFSSSGFWAFVADGFLSIVDMSDPASGLTHTVERQANSLYSFTSVNKLNLTYPTPAGTWTPWPNYGDKVWKVRDANQILTSYDKVNYWFFMYSGVLGSTGVIRRYSSPTSSTFIYPSLDHWDATQVPNLWYIYPFGSGITAFWRSGYWYSQLPDHTWFATTLYGDDLYYSNFADYIPPSFTTSGPRNNGWWTPYCGTSTYCGPLSGPIQLKVQVIDDVAVTRVTFHALYYSGADWSWEHCSPGSVNLGSASGPDANSFWTKTVSPADFNWTGWVQFYATARDAGYNQTTQNNTGGYWFVNAAPAIEVFVGPAGADFSYVWSTTTAGARVTPVQGDTHAVRVLFKVDGLAIGDGIYNPSIDAWYVNWNTTQVGDGNHNVTGEVTFSHGGFAASGPVTKYVANLGPPSYMASPSPGAVVSGSITVSAQLSDLAYPVPIERVDFFLDRPNGSSSGGTLIGTATAGTLGLYAIPWDSSTATDGGHTIVAVFSDRRWDGSQVARPSNWVSFTKVAPAPNPKECSPLGAPMTASKGTGS